MATSDPKKNWADIGFKLLSLLFLPVFGVGIAMYTEQSVTRERIANIQSQQAQIRTQLDTVDTRINAIALTVQETSGQIRELRTVLDIIRTQVSNQNHR